MEGEGDWKRKDNTNSEDEDNIGIANVNDLTKLDDITLQNVLDCLIQRFHSKQYCTFAGDVLIALNPCLSQRFKRHPCIFNTYESTKDVGRFVEMAKNGNYLDVRKLEPHALSLGVKSLYNIRKIGNNQVIVVSGDSGAGKTTCTQDLIKFFTYSDNSVDEFFTLEKKIYEATLILEALGNASTAANPNSSRFGRLVRLQYNKECKIVGAEIKTYLLEKHRVAKGNPNERNFHIFHYLLQAIEQDYLDGRNKDVFTNSFWASNVQDTDLIKFKNLSTSLTILDLLDHFIQVFEFLFAIMHLLTIEFEVENVIEDDKENFIAHRPSHFAVSEATWSHLSSASQILGLNETEMHNSLIYHTFSAGNRKSVSLSPCAKKEDCESRLHSFISTLYERLFHRIVAYLNLLLKQHQQNESSLIDSEPNNGSNSTVSILDLYGFENLDFNHFEQLCINYANERIQQVQVSVLKGYFEEERRVSGVSTTFDEPIELNRVETDSNLRLEELHQRVFCILDEACLLKRQTPDKEVFEQMAIKSKNDQFIMTGKLHDPKCQFIIRHYASDVNYSMAGMIIKNKDFIPEEFLSLLSRSVKPFVRDLFPNEKLNLDTVSTPSKRKPEGRKTILMRFKASVNELVSELCEKETRDVHFIKCIRPNDLVANIVHPEVVKKQLFACGIIDIIRIAGNGFQIRLSTPKFLENFPQAVKEFCGQQFHQERFLKIFASKSSSLQFGKSYVFMSERTLTKIEKCEQLFRRLAAKRIQCSWRAYLTKKRALLICNTAAKRIQSSWRAYLKSKRAILIRNTAAKRIQSSWRAYSLELKRTRHIKKMFITDDPLQMQSSSFNSSIYFTPMTSGVGISENPDSFYSVGPHENSLNLNSSGQESPVENGMSMSNGSLEDFEYSHSYPSWINNSHENNDDDTIAAFRCTKFDILSSTFLPTESVTDSSNVTTEEALQMDIGNSLTSPALTSMPVQMKLFCGNGIISRAPVQTFPIKLYTKKTALGYIKQPKRLTSNGLADAIEEYGIIIEPKLYPPTSTPNEFLE